MVRRSVVKQRLGVDECRRLVDGSGLLQLLGGSDWGMLGSNRSLLGSKKILEHFESQVELRYGARLLLSLGGLGLLKLLHDALALLSRSDASLGVVEELG